MDENLQHKIIGELLSGKRDFAGYLVTITGCRFLSMRLLMKLLLDMDFTPTCSNEGESSITFYTSEERQ